MKNHRIFAMKCEFLLVLATLVGVWSSDSYLGCLDEDGKPVDRWLSVKQNNSPKYYVYEEDSSSFEKSSYSLDQDKNGMIMATMYQLYGGSLNFTDVVYAMYNDEPPPDSSASSSYAHAKGVIATNSKQGFWLFHSMPKWPNSISMGASELPDFKYAQTLECVTISGDTANDIAVGLMVSRPYIYDRGVGSNIEGTFPELESWVNGAHTDSDVMTYTKEFKSWNGAVYTMLEKSKNWGKDFWDDLVAPYYKAPLNVETWRSGSGGRMGSICPSGVSEPKTDKYDVIEVSTIAMPDGVTWSGTKDHSKWASTGDSSSYISCLGDLNRMCSQETRGGGGVCRKEDNRWRAFNNIIGSSEPCWAYDPCETTYDSCYWCPVSLDGLKLEDIDNKTSKD